MISLLSWAAQFPHYRWHDAVNAASQSTQGKADIIVNIPRRADNPHCKLHRSNQWENPMNEEALNLSIRKFLKTVGVSSQREIEHAVAKAAAAGTLTGTESFPATMTLEIVGLKVNVAFSGDITLQ
jgi:hypothetical protein